MYATARIGPIRSGSSPGSQSASAPPSEMLDRMTSSTTIAPAKRPNRYSHFLIGALKKKCSTRYSKSCCTARPMIAAMIDRPNMPRNETVCAIAYGELIQTLPLPNDTIALLMMPPAAATQNTAIAKNTTKYTHVEMRLRRVATSKQAMVNALRIRRPAVRREWNQGGPRWRRSRRPPARPRRA